MGYVKLERGTVMLLILQPYANGLEKKPVVKISGTPNGKAVFNRTWVIINMRIQDGILVF